MSGENSLGTQSASALIGVAGIAVLPNTSGNIYVLVLSALLIVGGFATTATLIALKLKKSHQK